MRKSNYNMSSLYNDSDVERMNNEFPNIIKKINNQKLENISPTRGEFNLMREILLNFIKDKNRKIYGGYSQNKNIILENPNDAFYSDDCFPDIDFYTPKPIDDLIEICDLLHKNKFKHVIGREAVNKDTYTISIHGEVLCDIAYVPTNVYSKMPFVTIDGISYSDPHFMMIDLYQMLTEPYFSSRRWEKTFPRIQMLQKYYPFNPATKSVPKKEKFINSFSSLNENDKETLRSMANYIIGFMKNKKTFLLYGDYPFNHFLRESKLTESRNNTIYDYVSILTVEVISTNYVLDTSSIFDNLKKKYPEHSSHIKIKEHYPFWKYIDYNSIIYFKDFPILKISGDNCKCLPYKKIELKTLKKNSNEGKEFIQICSFDLNFLMCMILKFRNRVNDQKEEVNYYNIMISQLIYIRNYYLKINNKDMLDDTIFQQFSTECIGNPINPFDSSSLRRLKRREEKKPIVFTYVPISKPDLKYWNFSNTSGNEINNPNNLRLSKEDEIFTPSGGANDKSNYSDKKLFENTININIDSDKYNYDDDEDDDNDSTDSNSIIKKGKKKRTDKIKKRRTVKNDKIAKKKTDKISEKNNKNNKNNKNKMNENDDENENENENEERSDENKERSDEDGEELDENMLSKKTMDHFDGKSNETPNHNDLFSRTDIDNADIYDFEDH